MEIKILVMFFGFTFLCLEIAGQDVEHNKLVEKKSVQNLTAAPSNNTHAEVTQTVPAPVAPKLVLKSPTKEATPVSLPIEIKLTTPAPIKAKSDPVLCKQSKQESLCTKEPNPQRIREPTITFHSNESNNNEVPNKEPSNDHLKHVKFFEEISPNLNEKMNIGKHKVNQNKLKVKRNKKILVPTNQLNMPKSILTTFRRGNKNLNVINKEIVKNGSKECITISPIVQHVLKNGTRVRTQIVEIRESPVHEEHHDVTFHDNVTSEDVHEEINNLTTEIKHNNHKLREIPLTNDIPHSTILHLPTVSTEKETNIDTEEHSEFCHTNIEQNQIGEDNSASIDNVVITNHDIDEIIERCKPIKGESLYQGTNFASNPNWQYNQLYPTYYDQSTNQQNTPGYTAGQVQYYPLKESYPVIDEPKKDYSVNVKYNKDYSFLNPYQYPFQNKLEDYVTPLDDAENKQEKSHSHIETIQIDPQNLVCGGTALPYFNQRMIQQPNYYNRRYNYNLNPRRRFSYNEVIAPNRYKDKIWRSWKKTQIFIKGRNRTRPFQIELSRGNLYGKSMNVPLQYIQRNSLICLNGYYGNQNTPFYVRYSN